MTLQLNKELSNLKTAKINARLNFFMTCIFVDTVQTVSMSFTRWHVASFYGRPKRARTGMELSISDVGTGLKAGVSKAFADICKSRTYSINYIQLVQKRPGWSEKADN